MYNQEAYDRGKQHGIEAYHGENRAVLEEGLKIAAESLAEDQQRILRANGTFGQGGAWHSAQQEQMVRSDADYQRGLIAALIELLSQ